MELDQLCHLAQENSMNEIAFMSCVTNVAMKCMNSKSQQSDATGRYCIDIAYRRVEGANKCIRLGSSKCDIVSLNQHDRQPA